jgi:hypothetical protein
MRRNNETSVPAYKNRLERLDVTVPEELAAEISEARGRLMAFVEQCSAADWVSSPLGSSDPRPVCVIVDHVADAYEYLGSWIGELVSGGKVTVDSGVVDELNAKHASASTALSRDDVLAHLDRSGDAIIRLVGSLEIDQLASGEGRVELLAKIASRHADGHRSEMEGALGVTPEL